MKIEIYGFPSCPYYIKAVEYVKKIKDKYKIVETFSPIEPENWGEVLKKFSKKEHTSPLVVKDGKIIKGGCEGLLNTKLNKKSKKKSKKRSR